MAVEPWTAALAGGAALARPLLPLAGVERQKTVLIVDDEKLFLRSLSSGLAPYTAAFRVVTAENGREAVKVLASTEIDLVITDIKMPEMGGFQLLAYILRQCPKVPVVMMTAFGSPEIERMVTEMQVCQYVEKPIDLKELAELILSELQAAGQGHLRGFTISTFLQTVAMDQMTCTLTIQSGQLTGRIFFRDGQVLDATTAMASGDDAMLEILAWPEPEIEVLGGCRARERRVTRPLSDLLLDSCRIRDERESIPRHEPAAGALGALQSPSAVTQPNPLTKEKKMNVQALNAAVEGLKADLGAGLLATDIFTNADGQSIAGYNCQPKAAALFCQITGHMVSALKSAGFPNLGKYYMLHLEDNSMVIVMPLGDFQWGVLVDLSKTTLGLLLNVVLPKAHAACVEAMK